MKHHCRAPRLFSTTPHALSPFTMIRSFSKPLVTVSRIVWRTSNSERLRADTPTRGCIIAHCFVRVAFLYSIVSRDLFPFLIPQRSLRFMSTEAAPAAEKKAGASLFQRLSSFIVGAGVTALFTQFYIYEEVKDGNKLMLQKQADLEQRLAKLEKKK